MQASVPSSANRGGSLLDRGQALPEPSAVSRAAPNAPADAASLSSQTDATLLRCRPPRSKNHCIELVHGRLAAGQVAQERQPIVRKAQLGPALLLVCQRKKPCRRLLAAGCRPELDADATALASEQDGSGLTRLPPINVEQRT